MAHVVPELRATWSPWPLISSGKWQEGVRL